jgi:hypothetical protein
LEEKVIPTPYQAPKPTNLAIGLVFYDQAIVILLKVNLLINSKHFDG